jgi:hypothetical protein
MTKARKDAQDTVVSHLQAAEVTQPADGALDFPAPPIAPQLASIMKRLLPFILPIGSDQLDATPSPASPQWVAVIGAIGNDARWPHAWASATNSRNPHLPQRGFRQSYFVRRGRRQANSQRYTLAIGQYHAFRALAALRFADREAPFFAGKKVASIKHSSHCSKPRWSNPPSKARHACCQTPCSSQSRSRRQQVLGLGYREGRSRQRAPLRSTQRIPSTQARLSAGGRPRPRLRRGLGNKFSITVHCWSLSLIGELKPSARH